jgi:oligopeptide transport system substrate-binding protein
MDRASLRDQRARFEDEMVARLLEHSIYIERYYFHRDPRVCRKEELGALPLQYSLQDLAGRHPHHYLMIFSEGTGLIDPRTGRPQRWLNVFSHWAMRGLLTHEFSSTAGYLERALANTGFIVVPSSRDGIECFLENISTVVKSREPASVGGQAIPAMLLKRPERWLGSERPEEGVLTQLRDRLRAFLGQSGYDWLIACAFYPALQWELTLFWGRALGIKDAFEETLWKLVRLPWFRYGSMPDWLRVELIAELPPAKEQNIRRLLEKLLISALSNPDIPVSLEIATETEESDGKGGLRRSLKSGWDNLIAGKLLRRFLNTLPEESRLNDLVFLSVMSGGKLTVDVPRRLYSKLLQGKRPRGSIRHRMLLRAAGATAYEEDNHYKRGFLGSAYPRSLFFKGFSPRGKFRWPLLAALLLACASVAFLSLWSRPVKDTGPYFGVVAPPGGQVLRYSTGIADPESLDPQLSLGQPEEQIYMALYDGLAEYHPKTMEPIPSIATRWTISADASEYVFFLRRDAKFSNGDPIKASDFVYTFRRGLRPELASRAAWLAYDIKYAEAYNEGGAFVRDPATGRFVLASEAEPQFTGEGDTGGPRLAIRVELAPETEFHKFIRSPERLVVPSDEKERQKAFNNNPKLASLITGKELVPIRAEDIGVEAVDDYTLRVTLRQPAPYFIGLIPAPFFRVLHQRSIEQHVVNAFTQPNMVNSGAFKLSEYRPGEQIVVARNPFYWDAAHTGLDKIYFLLGEDSTDILDAYREGNSDVTGRVVPLANLAYFKTREDFIQHPYLGIAYLAINVKKPPTDDLRVRRAFNLAIDKNALAASRGMYPLTSFVPGRVFHGYPLPKGDSFDVEAAKRLLAEAGYRDASGEFDPSKFPADQVELTFITAESNLKVAEFVQAQWKQNLGITIPLRNVEWKTFLNQRSTLQYKGFALAGWVGDYMDPYTYLSLFTTVAGDNATGWYDVKYLQMLGEAERVPDQAKRYDMLAHAEAYLLDQQPVVPLLVMSANTLKKPYVKGLYPNPIMMYPWKYVYIEHDSSKWGPDVTETDDMLPP